MVPIVEKTKLKTYIIVTGDKKVIKQMKRNLEVEEVGLMKYFRDLIIIFVIFFCYLMYAGGTTIMQGIIAALGAGWFFALFAEMVRAVASVIKEGIDS